MYPRNSRRARWSWGQPEPPRGVGGAPRRARARWRAKTGLGMCLARRAPSRSSARAARAAPPTAPLSSLGRRLGRESGPEEHHGRSTGASKRTMALWGLSREISRSAETRPWSTTFRRLKLPRAQSIGTLFGPVNMASKGTKEKGTALPTKNNPQNTMVPSMCHPAACRIHPFYTRSPLLSAPC